MGWNSWNKFGCNVSEKMVREMADAAVSSGMKDAGYVYVVIDDCWQVSRDPQGNILADPDRFPSGMKALADYVHSKGLKFGLYSDAGTKTCAGRPGGRGYEYQDARQYAAWGVDYLKYDWCSHTTQDGPSSYALMSDALKQSGRPIVFSLCEWGSNHPWLWARDVGNLWRTTGDIEDKWSNDKRGQSLGVVQILDLQDGLASYAGPGHWNDPDMLEVGNGGMSTEEYRAHFSMWCMLGAPLIAGNDLRTMSADTREILTNKEVIAVDQDPLGNTGRAHLPRWRYRNLGEAARGWRTSCCASESRFGGVHHHGAMDGPRLPGTLERENPRPLGKTRPRLGGRKIWGRSSAARCRTAYGKTLELRVCRGRFAAGYADQTNGGGLNE